MALLLFAILLLSGSTGFSIKSYLVEKNKIWLSGIFLNIFVALFACFGFIRNLLMSF